MKGLGRKHPANTHNKRSLIRSSHVCDRRRAAGRNQQVKEYKHTHTHTHTHKHTHTVRTIRNIFFTFWKVRERCLTTAQSHNLES